MTNQQTNEAAVLFPDMELSIKDELITVREFSFLQGIKTQAIAAPFIKGLSAFFDDENEATFEKMQAVFSVHIEALIELMAISTGKSEQWISELNDTDGQALLMTFWSVNKAFFINRLLLKGMQAQQVQASDSSLAG